MRPFNAMICHLIILTCDVLTRLLHDVSDSVNLDTYWNAKTTYSTSMLYGYGSRYVYVYSSTCK